MSAINWSTQFSGFSDVGTALGDFVTNLITGLAPALILITIILGVLAIIGAVIYSVVKLVGSGMSKVSHKRG